jgi:Outer membrane protein beta-barrel domain
MERGFYQEDIDHLIKQKADQYKMYPSEKVWKGIYRSLHTRRKWYWFGFVLFLSGIGYYTAQLIAPAPNKSTTNTPPSVSNNTDATASTTKKEVAAILPFGSTTKQDNNKTDRSNRTVFILNPETNNEQQALDGSAIATNTVAITELAPVFDLQTGRIKQGSAISPADIILVPANDETLPHVFSTPAIESIETQVQAERSLDRSPLAKNEEATEESRKINWLQEFAVFELAPAKPKRLNWQLSFSPTMSYRKLTGSRDANIPSQVKNVPIALNIEGDPDKLLNHKPALGFEFGSHIIYVVDKDLSVKAGLQFNYSRYDIQAYSTPEEEATISLTSVGASPPSSITTVSNLRNFGGDNVEALRNQYFQLSVPVGLELRLIGNDKLQLNIAGTLQPTYLLNRNTFLITTDYKNYTKEPSLVRRWNMNTSAEAFVSYKTGELKWQVGPQFRYQLLSTYISKYPIREHLMEYGIKIGVTKTIR